MLGKEIQSFDVDGTQALPEPQASRIMIPCKLELTPAEQEVLNNVRAWQKKSADSKVTLGGPFPTTTF